MKKTVLIFMAIIAVVALCYAWSKSPCSQGCATEKEALDPYVKSLGEPQGISQAMVDGLLGTEYSWDVGKVRRAIVIVKTERGYGVARLFEYPEGQ